MFETLDNSKEVSMRMAIPGDALNRLVSRLPSPFEQMSLDSSTSSKVCKAISTRKRSSSKVQLEQSSSPMVEGQGQEALKPFVRWLGGVSGWSEHCGLPLPGYFYLAYNLVGLFTFTEQEEEELRTAWQEGREHANRLLAQFPFSTCGNNEENLQPASELDRPARPSGRVNQQNKLEVRLGKRQLEVLRLLVEDHTHAEIAEKLVISRRTVDAHIRLIYDKLDVHSRAEARRWAKENKLIS